MLSRLFDVVRKIFLGESSYDDPRDVERIAARAGRPASAEVVRAVTHGGDSRLFWRFYRGPVLGIGSDNPVVFQCVSANTTRWGVSRVRANPMDSAAIREAHARAEGLNVRRELMEVPASGLPRTAPPAVPPHSLAGGQATVAEEPGCPPARTRLDTVVPFEALTDGTYETNVARLVAEMDAFVGADPRVENGSIADLGLPDVSPWAYTVPRVNIPQTPAGPMPAFVPVESAMPASPGPMPALEAPAEPPAAPTAHTSGATQDITPVRAIVPVVPIPSTAGPVYRPMPFAEPMQEEVTRPTGEAVYAEALAAQKTRAITPPQRQLALTVGRRPALVPRRSMLSLPNGAEVTVLD